ncbi:MAG: SPOR domain-containing protein, partial [Spirochaetota bacterium]|nr:SPOR domain-containing protein [Spirochaetota bacterium]
IKKNKNTIYKIQLGAYYNLEYAVQQQKKFESNGFTTILCTYSGEGKTFRILTKKTFKSKHEANEINKTLKGKGIHAFVVEL